MVSPLLRLLGRQTLGMMMPKLITSTRTNMVTRARIPAHCHQDGFLYQGVPAAAITWAGSTQASTFPKRNLRSTIQSWQEGSPLL